MDSPKDSDTVTNNEVADKNEPKTDGQPVAPDDEFNDEFAGEHEDQDVVEGDGDHDGRVKDVVTEGESEDETSRGAGSGDSSIADMKPNREHVDTSEGGRNDDEAMEVDDCYTTDSENNHQSADPATDKITADSSSNCEEAGADKNQMPSELEPKNAEDQDLRRDDDLKDKAGTEDEAVAGPEEPFNQPASDGKSCEGESGIDLPTTAAEAETDRQVIQPQLSDDVIDLESIQFEVVDNLIGSSIKSEPVSIANVKVELLQESNMKEEILAEDDNNIVGIISGVDAFHDVLEEDLGGGGPVVDVKVKIEELDKPLLNVTFGKKKAQKRKKPEEIVIDIETAFSDQEDMALHAMDLISPYDIHFISSHLAKRTPKEIEKRLDDNFFRKKSFIFNKIPSFLFCMVFYNGNSLKFRALVNITEKLFSLLICVNKKCQHPEDISDVQVDYSGSAKFGIDLNVLVEFINENMPDRWRGALYMTADKLGKIMTDSKISFHRYGTTIGHAFSKKNKPKVQHKLKKKENPMKVVKGGRLELDTEHETTLVKIVSSVGYRWDTVLTLMNETFGKTKCQGVRGQVKLQTIIKDYYLCHLDNRKTEPFTEEEDKCLLFLHKFFFSALHLGHEDQRWKCIARHIEGRTPEDCMERLKRKSTNKNDLSLDNLDLEDIHDDVPSLFYYNESHIFGLTVVPKDESIELLDVPTRLQMEFRFIIGGTVDEVFIMPCKESAMRCMHQGFHTMQFTYNPAKPDSQFETYLKLTFANELKRVNLIDEEMSKSFNFNQINYRGKGIHEIIENLTKNRFILPREHFMSVNEKEDKKCNGGKKGFTTEAYYLEDF